MDENLGDKREKEAFGCFQVLLEPEIQEGARAGCVSLFCTAFKPLALP